MTYEEKGTWVYLVVSATTYLVYVAVILGRAGQAALVDVPYVAPMLWTIGISIAANMFGRIAVEIAKPSQPQRGDVRDRDINRFGERVGGLALAVGMTVPLVLTLLEADYFWIANAIFLVFVLHAVTSSVVRILAYRRGLAL